jgi:hypothetical protein
VLDGDVGRNVTCTPGCFSYLPDSCEAISSEQGAAAGDVGWTARATRGRWRIRTEEDPVLRLTPDP